MDMDHGLVQLCFVPRQYGYYVIILVLLALPFVIHTVSNGLGSNSVNN